MKHRSLGEKRNIPFAEIDQVDKELESLDITEKTDHADWTAPMVLREKEEKETKNLCKLFNLVECSFTGLKITRGPPQQMRESEGRIYWIKS